MSARLPRKASPAAPERNEGTWIAVFFMLGGVFGILGLISMIMPDIFGLLVVLAAFGGFVALHYFTWGRWLMQAASRSRKAEQAEHSPPAESSVKSDLP